MILVGALGTSSRALAAGTRSPVSRASSHGARSSTISVSPSRRAYAAPRSSATRANHEMEVDRGRISAGEKNEGGSPSLTVSETKPSPRGYGTSAWLKVRRGSFGDTAKTGNLASLAWGH